MVVADITATMRGAIVSAILIPAALTALVLAGCDSSITLTGPSGVVQPSAAPTVSLPLAGRATAQLQVTAGFTAVTVTSAAIGSDLVRVSSPPDGRAVPTATVNGDVVTIGRRAIPASGSGPDAVQIELNDQARWQLALAGGASDVTITLSAHSGTTPVMIAAGVSDLRLQVPAVEPVRVTVGAGAGSTTIDGVPHSGIAAGTTFTAPLWDTAAARIDLDCTAGVGSIAVTHT